MKNKKRRRHHHIIPPPDNADFRLQFNPVAFAAERLGLAPDAKQAEVLNAETNRGILNCSRQWGKSTVTAAKAIHRAWFTPGALILVVSPSERQSAEFLTKASALLRTLGTRPRGDGKNPISLLLPNGARIVGLPGVEATVRGFSAVNLMLIDEAARVKEDTYRAVRPMLAVGGGELWMMSTPHGRQGFFWETWDRGGPEWTRFSVTATECPRIDPAFLDEERRTQGETWFRQEYMCEFTDTEYALFTEDVLRDAIDPNIKPLFFD